MTKFYEDNGGQIHALVYGPDGALQNYLCGFEHDNFPVEELLQAALLGFPEADTYDPDDYYGTTLDEQAEWFDANPRDCDLIAEVSDNQISIYPNAMGIAGRILFGLHSW